MQLIKYNFMSCSFEDDFLLEYNYLKAARWINKLLEHANKPC